MKQQLKTHIAKLRSKISLLKGIYNDAKKQGHYDIARSKEEQIDLLKTEVQDLTLIYNLELNKTHD